MNPESIPINSMTKIYLLLDHLYHLYLIIYVKNIADVITFATLLLYHLFISFVHGYFNIWNTLHRLGGINMIILTPDDICPGVTKSSSQ